MSDTAFMAIYVLGVLVHWRNDVLCSSGDKKTPGPVIKAKDVLHRSPLWQTQDPTQEEDILSNNQ